MHLLYILYYILHIYFYDIFCLKIFYCYSITVVCIFSPASTPPQLNQNIHLSVVFIPKFKTNVDCWKYDMQIGYRYRLDSNYSIQILRMQYSLKKRKEHTEDISVEYT